MKNPKVTVLMSVYNGEKYLREAIDSILNQTFMDFEFLIVNDGSADSTVEILQSYDDPRIKIINNVENIGLTKSLNKGLGMAKGEYIARMDADDISFQNRLEKQIDFIEQNPQVAVVGGPVVRINNHGVPFGTSRYPLQDQQIKETLLSSGCCIAHPTALILTKALHAVGGYRKAFLNAQDYDLWLRLADNYELANLSDPVLYLRIHGAQVSNQKLRKQIIFSIGARTAAKIRRETGLDPLDEEDFVTIELLGMLGVQDEIIQKALIGGYIWWAGEMCTIGAKTTMLQFLTEARKIAYSHESYNLKQVLANCYFRCARICYYQKGYNIGLRFLIEAIRLDPAILMRAAKHLFRFLQPHNASNHYG